MGEFFHFVNSVVPWLDYVVGLTLTKRISEIFCVLCPVWKKWQMELLQILTWILMNRKVSKKPVQRNNLSDQHIGYADRIQFPDFKVQVTAQIYPYFSGSIVYLV